MDRFSSDIRGEKLKELEEILKEAQKGFGAFSLNNLTHAENTIDSMKLLIGKALIKLKEIQ